ncbi:enoyl-CoA hydratase/isomerase family protein [Hymenobacter daeguensis]
MKLTKKPLSVEKMAHAPMTLTKHSASFWRVTLDNPPINLLTPEMITGMQQLMDQVEADKDLKVIVFDSANEDYFISHYDVMRGSEVAAVSGKLGVNQWTDVSNRLHTSSVISIASIRGRARGNGSEFVLACDMRFASREKALFCQIEVGAGVVAGGGGLEYLPLLAGRSRALEILVGSNDFDADTAAQYGWINRALPDAELDDFVNDLAIRISTYQGVAIAETKALVNKRTAGAPYPQDIEESLATFQKLAARPEVQAVWGRLAALGFQQPSDLELRFGYHLGQIAAEQFAAE